MYARATMTAPGYGMALGIRWFDILPGFRRAATDISAAGPREAYRVSRTRGMGNNRTGCSRCETLIVSGPPIAGRRGPSQSVPVAGYLVDGSELVGFGVIVRAAVQGHRAAGVGVAARRRVERRRDLYPQNRTCGDTISARQAEWQGPRWHGR